MVKIGRGMSRDIQTRFVDANPGCKQRNVFKKYFSPLKASKEFLE